MNARPLLVFVALLLSSFPRLATAQEPRLRVGMAGGIATPDGTAAPMASGLVGFRFARGLWFETEITWIDDRPVDSGDLAIPGPLNPSNPPTAGAGASGEPPSFPGVTPIATATDRTTLMGTLGMRWEIVESGRLRPYVAGGLGVNRSEDEFRIASDPGTVLEAIVHTGYAWSAGAGSSMRLAGPWWIDVNATYLRLSRGRNLMRVGAGASVRF